LEKKTKSDLQKILQYLKLDLDNVPDVLTDYDAVNFNVARLSNDKDHRIFRYVSIDQIEILVTPCLRTDPLRDKYSKAMPLYKYILPADTEEDIERYTMFLKMLKSVSIPEIENVANIQKEMDKKEPFKVVFPKDNMWQIYYSENTGKYFMLVCTKENTFAEFFYLMKLKIENESKKGKSSPKIYVPINATNYSEEFLNRDEIADVENYLWLFTKNWARTFEVYSKTNVLSLQIVGETVVYDDVKSNYKIKISNREEALKLFKLLKALFIMQTEIKDHFNFITKIDSNNSLEFYLGQVRLTYDMLTDFIRDEVGICQEEIKEQNLRIDDIQKELTDIKFAVKSKENEYMQKQREISTFLEYKKTFFGKVKYFFSSPKINKKLSNKLNEEEEKPEEVDNKVNIVPIQEAFKTKKFYTIEDLVTIYSLFEKSERNYKNLNQDLKAQRLKLENIVSKVKNANQYIEEIDKHRKSIFDFWKFSNKDEKLSLEMGEEGENDESKNSLKKVFDYETDLEDLGIQVDTIQRKKLSKEELDSMYIAGTNILYLINMIRDDEMDKLALENTLDELKEEFQENKLYIESETFDIFGNVEDDSRKLKYIGSKSHRENERNKFKILNVNKNIDVFDFTEKLQSLKNYLEGAIPKVQAEYDFSLYKICQITEKVNPDSFEVYNLNVEKALEEYEDDGEGALNLIKINYQEGMPLLYFSNIVYYDNYNQTLPLGMNVSSNVLVDTKRLSFKLVAKNKFRTNMYFTESNNMILPKTKDVFVYEYDVKLKDKDSKDEEDEDEGGELDD